MTIHSAPRGFLLTALVVLTFGAALPVHSEIREGVLGSKTLANPGPTHVSKLCPTGQYLVGIGLTQTDRVIGYWQDCIQMDSKGLWSGGPGLALGVGAATGGRKSTKQCPEQYFIVGLGATTGEYTKDTGIAAKAVPVDLIADLQPVCRQVVSPQAVYSVQRGYFEKADDNNLKDVAGAPVGAKSCAPGQAAVGIAFAFDATRGLDPANQFQDAALICDRVKMIPTTVTNTVVH